MDLISLHVPKCAGTALRDALVRAFGEDTIYFDNSDRLLDPQSPVNLHPDQFIQDFKTRRDKVLGGKSVVHGHFCLHKYDGIPAPRVTILRNPVDRLISHYLFWQHLAPHGHTLHDRFLAEQPTLTDFARIPGLRHFYRGVLFRDVDMAIFDLVGSVENMPETTARLQQLAGRQLLLEKSNENSCDHCHQKKSEIMGDSSVISELQTILKDDIAFYERYALRFST